MQFEFNLLLTRSVPPIQKLSCIFQTLYEFVVGLTDCMVMAIELPQVLRQGNQRMYLNLGTVNHLAEVRLNGKDLGVVWTAPWQVEITAAVRPTDNKVEIDLVNLWPNRLIGDAALPPEKRLTKTNVSRFKKDSPLLPSGLLGPVSVMAEDRIE